MPHRYFDKADNVTSESLGKNADCGVGTGSSKTDEAHCFCKTSHAQRFGDCHRYGSPRESSRLRSLLPFSGLR